MAFATELQQATLVNGLVNHYVDHYRYLPPRLLCRQPGLEVTIAVKDAPLCKLCVKVAKNYPTEAEFLEYMKCTDCGVDTWSLGEVHYQVIMATWEQAYPGYNKFHIGLGSSRPCIGCLETRLQRTLTKGDFTRWQKPEVGFSDRLNHRLTAVE